MPFIVGKNTGIRRVSGRGLVTGFGSSKLLLLPGAGQKSSSQQSLDDSLSHLLYDLQTEGVHQRAAPSSISSFSTNLDKKKSSTEDIERQQSLSLQSQNNSIENVNSIVSIHDTTGNTICNEAQEEALAALSKLNEGTNSKYIIIY